MIINRLGQNNTVETTINHGPNIEIESVDAWHRKKTFKDRLFLGPSVNVGFDPLAKKPTFSVGVSFGYNFLN